MSDDFGGSSDWGGPGSSGDPFSGGGPDGSVNSGNDPGGGPGLDAYAPTADPTAPPTAGPSPDFTQSLLDAARSNTDPGALLDAIGSPQNNPELQSAADAIVAAPAPSLLDKLTDPNRVIPYLLGPPGIVPGILSTLVSIARDLGFDVAPKGDVPDLGNAGGTQVARDAGGGSDAPSSGGSATLSPQLELTAAAPPAPAATSQYDFLSTGAPGTSTPTVGDYSYPAVAAYSPPPLSTGQYDFLTQGAALDAPPYQSATPTPQNASGGDGAGGTGAPAGSPAGGISLAAVAAGLLVLGGN